MTDDRTAWSRRRLIRLSATAAAALTAAACSTRPSGSSATSGSTDIARDIKADIIYRGGTIVTMVDDRRQAQALAVAGGRIIAVGDEPDVLATKGPGTQVVDLAGRTLMPGLIDLHVHVTATRMDIGQQARMPNVFVLLRTLPILKGMLMRGFTSVRRLCARAMK